MLFGGVNPTEIIKWHGNLGDKICVPNKEDGLGFRNLKAFNLALLAKQAWRLQTNTQSLVYRVLKAQYFPYTDFL